jgi:hypothetical protein
MCSSSEELMEDQMNSGKSASNRKPMIPPRKESTVYFYYVDVRDRKYIVEAYEKHDIINGLPELNSLILSLVANALGDKGNPPLYSTGFDDLVRYRKGYFIVALDGANFKATTDPITFTLDYTSAAPNKPLPTPLPGNYTFKPVGSVITIPVADRNIQVAVYYDHIIKNDGGDWGKHEWEHFMLDLNLGLKRLLGDGSGGTNMGPPPPPPLPADMVPRQARRGKA